MSFDLSEVKFNEQGLVPAIAQIISPEFADDLIRNSTLINTVTNIDLLHVGQMLKVLIGA